MEITENNPCANGSRSHRVLNMATGTHPTFPLRESDISRIARLPNHAQGFFAFDGARQKPGTWMASKTDIRRERKPSPLTRITGRTEIQHSDDAGLTALVPSRVRSFDFATTARPRRQSRGWAWINQPHSLAKPPV